MRRLRRAETKRFSIRIWDLETPLELYSRSCGSFRLAEQLRAATLNIAETVANEVSSASFLTAAPLGADSFIILFGKKDING
jgi:hypothetical protein